MNKPELSPIKNILFSSKPSKAISLLLMVLFVCLYGNVARAQTASSCTWALTSNGNSVNTGNVSGTNLAIGSGLNNVSYGTTGVTTGSWSNDAGSLRNDEYYEVEVTPNANTIFNVTTINFEHSISNGNWQVRAYYSTDGFLTSTAISTAFVSNSTTPAANNNTVIINVEASTLSIRIYGWESDGNGRSLRIRNVVISGTTCTKPISAGAITGPTSVCQGKNNVAYSVPAITNATGYIWTLPSGATIVSGANTNAITVNYSPAANSGNISVQGTNTCGNGTISTNYPITVNTAPTVTAATSLASICSGGDTTLSASAIPTTQNTVLLSEGFNAASNTWTKTNNSSGGGSTPANAAWTLRPDGYSYTYPGYSAQIFHSNDNSQFYLSNSADQGNGTTATLLQSPVMNTVGYTSLSLEFYQYNLDFDTTDFARVEVSTNGTTWTTLSTTTTTQGMQNNFLKTTINLDTYINQATLYIRFKYDAQFDWFWAIDNVTVSGNKTIDYTYSWSVSQSGTAGLPSGAGTTSVSNNSIVANPTITTSYTVTATNPLTGCIGTSIINVSVNSNNWTGASGASGSGSWFTPGNWSCNTVPTSATNVIIPNVTNKPVVDDITKIAKANMVTVQLGSSLIVNSGNTLSLNDALINNGGTLTFEDSASLVQINNVANSGNIRYLRRTNTTVISTDYTYWSSPVSGQTMFNLSPNTLPSMFYSYQVTATDEDWQQESSAITMAPGVGYSIGGPKVITPPETYLATFTGVPNNGTITLSNIIANKSYLLGNPYPSAIDADTFLNQNATVLGGTLYFWTHNTTLQDRNIILSTAGSGALAYTSDDYATYNITGGVGIDPGSSTSSAASPGANTSIPSGKIAAGQGFFASSQASIPAGSSIVFNNTIRLAGEIAGVKNNNQFFKTKNPNTKSVSTIEKHRVWLNLSNTQGAFKQTLIGYITKATNKHESRFDGESFDGNEYVDFYSINQNKNLVIQGRALPFDENDEVPLGYRTTINGDFTINIAQTDGLLNNQNVFIEDKVTNKVVNLKEGNYTFNTAAGTFDDRFVLKYTNKTLDVDAMDKVDGILVLYSKNYKTLIIHNNMMDSTVNTVTLYNTTGQKISNWDVEDSGQTNIQIPIKNISSGIYIVKVNTTKGESSKKIIVN
jgi:hypothetical protein